MIQEELKQLNWIANEGKEVTLMAGGMGKEKVDIEAKFLELAQPFIQDNDELSDRFFEANSPDKLDNAMFLAAWLQGVAFEESAKAKKIEELANDAVETAQNDKPGTALDRIKGEE